MEFIKTFLTTDGIIILSGLAVFSYWLLRTSFGTTALEDSVPRRNNMPFFMPFVLLLFSLVAISIGSLFVARMGMDLQTWQGAFFNNLMSCLGGLIAVGVIVIFARLFFARGLKGFGLNVRTIHKDLFASFLNLLAVWPLVLAALAATTFICQLIWDPQYQLQQHQELELLSKYPQLPSRILVVIVSVAVVPVLEEMVFRGFFQTMIRSVLRIRHAVWLAIAASSFLFTIMHADPAHWPALFILGVGIGYSYEKSGSLFRPIFIHVLFNASSVVATWVQ